MARWLVALSLVLFVGAGSGLAQELTRFLPNETVFALGVQDLAEHADKLDAILTEAERLELGDILSNLFGEFEDELEGELEGEEDLSVDVPEEFEDFDVMEVLGNEAWLVVSLSEFNPLPAITLVTRTSGATGQALIEDLQANSGDEDVTTMQEGDVDIYLFSMDEEPDSPIQAIAVSATDDLLVVSTNPDVLRGVLRRVAGGSEASFSDAEGYQATLAQLGSGTSYSFIDFTMVATAIEPFGAMATGFENLAARGLSGLGTFGAMGSVTRVDDSGMSSASIRMPGDADPELAQLIVGEPGVSRAPLAFVPADSLAVTVGQLDLPGWWAYLSELARSSDELGNPDLNMLATEVAGIDIENTLLSWMGIEAATITGSLGDVVQPGVPSQNLLGESVYLLEVTDEQAAEQGLSMFFGMASAIVSGFSDPSGEGMPGMEQREVGGATVTSYSMGPGLEIAHAVTDGWALIATSNEVMDAALTARAAGGEMGEVLTRLAGEVPEDASSFSLSNYGEMLGQIGPQYAAQIQMFAGLAGGDIDFAELQRASDAIVEFFDFLAERAGGAVSYSVPQADGSVRSEGRSEFDW